MSRNTSLLVALTLFAAAIASASLNGQAREATSAGTATTSARARVDTAFLPRTADQYTAAGRQVDLSATLYAMTHTVFEAEDWGDIPTLGLSVQDMTSFGSTWSGNKQIFWNPAAAHSFKWDFKAPAGKRLTLDLTAAPDYGLMKITLVCYKQHAPPYTFYVPVETVARTHDGYATSVRRQRVEILLSAPCRQADAYRLIFTLTQASPDRRFGGIDRIVVAK